MKPVTVGHLTKISSSSLQWKIDAFPSYLTIRSPEKLESPSFKIHPDVLGRWQLRICPWGDEFPQDFGYISTFLYYSPPPESKDKIYMSWKLAIKDMDGDHYYPVVRSESHDEFYTSMGWGFGRFLSHDEFRNNAEMLVPGNTLTLVLKWDIDFQQSLIVTTHATFKLCEDFQSLLETGDYSDFTIVSADGIETPVHRVILSARSPVFAAMLKYNTLEKQTGVVNIQDVGHKAIQSILFYMYTGKKPEKLQTMAAEILKAADKYDLDILKIMCEAHMSINLEVPNITSTLKLAQTHNCSLLKRECILFAAKNLEAWKSSSHWQEEDLPEDVMREIEETKLT